MALDSTFECTDSALIASYVQFVQDIPNNMSLSATDLCPLGPVTITEVNDTTDFGCTGQYIRTITFVATDVCGNTSTPYDVNILVEDNEPPVWDYAPGELDLAFACLEDVTPAEIPTAYDFCNAAPAIIRLVEENTVPGSCNNQSTTTISYSARDGCGNLSEIYTITITVNDNIPPQWDQPTGSLDSTFTCAADLAVPPPPTASDNCGDPIVNIVQDSDITIPGICDDRFERIISYLATDECGNVSDTFSITLTVDNTRGRSTGSFRCFL